MFTRLLFVTALALLVGSLAACAPQPAPTEPATSENMAMDDMAAAPVIPAGLAYAGGQEIRFIHTEVSEPEVAGMLSDMMDSPVIHVPALAEAPESMLANVYVFKNGIEGMGPLGFQPDVFDNPPDTEGYSPLRRIIFATWTEGSTARELKSLDEVLAAGNNGELTLETSSVVVNMPFVTWPGGER